MNQRKSNRDDRDEREDDDFEILDDEPPRKKPQPPIVDEDEDGEPPPRRRRAESSDEEDSPVRRKKKKKKKPAIVLAEVDEPNEWILPLILAGIGLVLTIVGTIGIAGHKDFPLSAGAAVTFRVFGQLLAIPITIAALIGIGTVMGIEYGTLKSTILNLAALGFLVGGLIDVCDWLNLPWFIYQPFILIVGLGLLISLFGLDADEAITTMVGLNVISTLLQMGVFILMVILLHKAVNKKDKFGSPSDRTPGWVEPDELDDPDEPEPEAMPRPKGKAKGQGVPPKPKQPIKPFNPDERP